VLVIEALVSGPVGVILGWALSYFQSRSSNKKAERAMLLAQMQNLVVAVLELHGARELHNAQHSGRRARLQVFLHMAAEVLSVVHQPGNSGPSWNGFAQSLGPVSRVLRGWERGSVDGVGDLLVAMSRVAAAGLPLGMCSDPAVAQAAQRLMDASLDGEDRQTLDRLVHELRVAFYPEEAQPATP
jgi:hypothetical protein